MGNLVKTVHHKKEDIKVTFGVQSFHNTDSSDVQQIREATCRHVNSL